MSAELVPAPSPLLMLLRNLAAVAVESPALAQGRLRLRGVEPLADGLALDLDAQGVFPGLDGPYRLEVAILRTGRESTLCDVRVAEGRVVAKVANWVRRFVPGSFVNEFLRGKAGGSLHMEGDRVAIDHQALIAWLLKK